MYKRFAVLFTALFTLLFALSALSAAASASTSETYCIEVDIANQITTVYRFSNKAVVRQMICSTGTGDKTPLGSFRLQKTRASTDRKEWYYISTYHCYVKFATRLKGGILFHSIPYNDMDLDSIDREALAQLGSKASHGCIRLRWEDARWIAMNCPDGTRVRVFDDAETDSDLRQVLLEEGYASDCGLSYPQFLASAFRDDGSGSLGRGSTGEAVAALQRRLTGLGFFSGEFSDRYDGRTAQAVMRYQTALSQEANGIASAALIERIMSEDKPTAAYSTLAPGCEGPLVTKLQTTLRDIGFYSGAIDGHYGDDLAAAVETYCACTGEEITDRASPRLRSKARALLKRLDRRYGAGKYTLAVLPEQATTATAVKNAPLYDAVSVSGRRLATVPAGDPVQLVERIGGWYRVMYERTVGYMKSGSLRIDARGALIPHWGPSAEEVGAGDMTSGAVGAGVTALKERLHALGFFTGALTPVYDGDASEAVAAYQAAAALEQTGDADASLQQAIMGRDDVTGARVSLKSGMRGPAVAAFQRALKSLQYFSAQCNGLFGRTTLAAARLFARTNGLSQSNVATPELQQAVFDQFLDCEEKYGSGNYVLSFVPVESRVASAKSRTALYTQRNVKSAPVASLKAGAEADVLWEGKTWCKLRFGSQTGYARKRTLDIGTRSVEVATFNAPQADEPGEILYGTEETSEVAASALYDGIDADAAVFNGITVEAYEPVEADTGAVFQPVPPAQDPECGDEGAELVE